MVAYLLGALIFATGIAVFVFQNTALVTVHFINWVSPQVSLAVVALVAALVGALMAFLLDSIRYFKVAKQVKELMNTNRRLEKELASLRKTETSSADETKKTNPLSSLSSMVRKKNSRVENESQTADPPPINAGEVPEKPAESQE
jgi:uncharacterized integral membrane protein